MLIIGLVAVAVAIVVMVGAGRKTAQQSRRAGADPSAGELAYAHEGGVSKATSAAMLGGWVLLIAGAVLVIIGLV